jgi:hypothetical protein
MLFKVRRKGGGREEGRGYLDHLPPLGDGRQLLHHHVEGRCPQHNPLAAQHLEEVEGLEVPTGVRQETDHPVEAPWEGGRGEFLVLHPVQTFGHKPKAFFPLL